MDWPRTEACAVRAVSGGFVCLRYNTRVLPVRAGPSSVPQISSLARIIPTAPSKACEEDHLSHRRYTGESIFFSRSVLSVFLSASIRGPFVSLRVKSTLSRIQKKAQSAAALSLSSRRDGPYLPPGGVIGGRFWFCCPICTRCWYICCSVWLMFCWSRTGGIGTGKVFGTLVCTTPGASGGCMD